MSEPEFLKIVKRGFDEAAPGYDNPALRFFSNSAHHLVETLPIKGSERYLDIATGTGNIAIPLAQRLKHGEVEANDLSSGMLARAQAKALQTQLSNITFSCGDVETLNFPKDHFDGMTCGFGIFFWTEMEKVLRKLLTMLKPAGTFAMTSFAAGSFLPLSDLCLERFKKYNVKLPETYSWTRLDSIEKHRQLIAAAGLKTVHSEVKSMGYFLADVSDWWEIVQYTGFRSFLNQLTPPQIERYREEHLEEIKETASEEGIPLKVDVIFTTAEKTES